MFTASVFTTRMRRCCQNVECVSCLSWAWAKMSTPSLLSWQKVPESSPATCSGVNPTLPAWVRQCRLRAWWVLNTSEIIKPPLCCREIWLFFFAYIWVIFYNRLNLSWRIVLCLFLKLRYQKCLDARPPSLASCLPTPPTDSVARRVKKGVQSLLGSFKSYRSGSQSPWVGARMVYTPLNTRSITATPCHSHVLIH